MTARKIDLAEIPAVATEVIGGVSLVVMTITDWDTHRGDIVSQPEYLDPDEAEALAGELLRTAAIARNFNAARGKP